VYYHKGRICAVLFYDDDKYVQRDYIHSYFNTLFGIQNKPLVDVSSTTNPDSTLLLDSYPNAAFAVSSSRRLNSAYTGPALRVRRSSDSAELNIGFNSLGLLNEAALTVFCNGADGFVTTWYDQSGEGNNATQATTSAQPKIYDAATGLITRNDLPSIATLAGQGWTFTAIPLNDLSVFIVGNTPANAAMLYGNSIQTRLFFTGINLDIIYAGITNGAYSQPSADTFNSHLRTLLREDGVSESVYYDGSQLTQLVQGGSGQINVNSTMPVRAGDPSRVFQEIIIYPSDQSANREGIESNINDHYGIYADGLIDNYPGTAAAYSLRLLSDDYTGEAIRVRRSTDSAELNIGFIGGELDTQTLNTFCSGADGFVSVWYDQSGNANDATQATTSAQPKIYDAATGVQLVNALPAMGDFVANQGMLFNSVIQATNQFVICVGYFQSNNILIGSNDYFVFARPGDVLIRANGISETYSTITNGAQTLLSYNRDGVANELKENGSSLGTSSSLTIQVSDYDGIGNYSRASASAFKAQEIIIYPSDQSANRADIEANTAAYYGITLTPPVAPTPDPVLTPTIASHTTISGAMATEAEVVTMDLPSDLEVGDVLLMVYSGGKDNSMPGFGAVGFNFPPESWNKPWETIYSQGNFSSAGITVLYRVVDGTETNFSEELYARTFTAGPMYYTISILRLTNVDIANNFVTIGTGINVSNNTTNIPSITTTKTNALAFAVAAYDGADFGVFEPNLPWVEYLELENVDGEENGTSLVIATQTMASVGATGDATIVVTSEGGDSAFDGMVGVQFAINSPDGE
jgi:hypothetical protein